MKCRKFILLTERGRHHLLLLYACMFAIICTLIAGSIFFVRRSKAADKLHSHKYYTSLEIKNGDTLWSIASEYGTEEYGDLQDYVAEVKALNGLKGDTIHSGQFLIIPYYSYELK